MRHKTSVPAWNVLFAARQSLLIVEKQFVKIVCRNWCVCSDWLTTAERKSVMQKTGFPRSELHGLLQQYSQISRKRVDDEYRAD